MSRFFSVGPFPFGVIACFGAAFFTVIFVGVAFLAVAFLEVALLLISAPALALDRFSRCRTARLVWRSDEGTAPREEDRVRHRLAARLGPGDSLAGDARPD